MNIGGVTKKGILLEPIIIWGGKCGNLGLHKQESSEFQPSSMITCGKTILGDTRLHATLELLVNY
jgi:hypothetical protein